MVINRLDPSELSPEMYAKATAEGLNSFCDIPLIGHNRLLGVLAVAKRQENAFVKEAVAFLTQVANQVAIGVENALAYSEIAELKDRLAQEKLYLEDELRGEMDFEGIVGQSSALRHVLNLVETVAPSDSTVLMLGETGTGKELIARAIHERSRRKDRTFVKINCAAIPTGLLESELFGHERGAFTGAITQKIGRLELADQGTLFLDEVGDIPLEIQPKLLRALQEREFERLGSTHTKKVNVRLVAATNRDLEKMIEDREFRSDLYYRLNVFPIRIPPLRERPEDIPLLVRYFTQKYARRMEKQIESIPSSAMRRLTSWHWPGNIRELQNFIERSVILTRGSALEVPIGALGNNIGNPAAVATPRDSTERDEILHVLKETNGRVAGPNGAAARMGLKRTTLISRMKKLGIDPRRV
jgi:formate hydrogenlyase transcriptional activator